MPDKYAQMDGGGSANRPNVKERQRQAAAKNRSLTGRGAAFGTDPTLAMPKTVKPKRKRK